MATLKDIAKEAGVSVMTVSRVVNGQHSKVSSGTYQRVQKILKEKNYVPNSSARSLSSKSSHIIAVVLRGKEDKLTNPYNASMVGEIVSLIEENGYFPMLHFIDDYDDITIKLHAWKAQGAIFLGAFDRDIEKIQSDNQISLVFTDSYSNVRQVNNVGIDDYKGGALAAQHFIGKGHSNFAFLGWDLSSSVVKMRLKGFSSAISKAGMRLDEGKIYQPCWPISTAAKKICEENQGPLALLVSADLLAIQLIDGIRQAGKEAPGDISIIGFDDLALGAYISPRLTTVVQDVAHKARLAVDMLFRHIKKPDMPAESSVLDVRLIERESVLQLY